MTHNFTIWSLRLVWAGALLLLAGCQQTTMAQAELSGRVTWVADGDTLQIEAQGNEYMIRLAGIDAPERDQPWADQARRALIRLTLHEHVTAHVVDIDDYDRYVARVFVGDMNVNRELVASGNAWVYRYYVADPVLFDLERQAREAREGLWRLPEEDRIPPWKWRHNR